MIASVGKTRDNLFLEIGHQIILPAVKGFKAEIKSGIRIDTDAAQTLFYERFQPYPVFAVFLVFFENGQVQIRPLFKLFPKLLYVFIPDLFGEQSVEKLQSFTPHPYLSSNLPV